tara:strand:+ start:201 stop:716 length:516 start_codon:yes stop_codon:yes gene_type:complete
MTYTIRSDENAIFPSPTVRDSQLYIMTHPRVEGSKIGLAVDAKSRSKGVGDNITVEMSTKKVDRDTAEAIEHLAQAYALVKVGQIESRKNGNIEELPKEIVSGRSEFFRATVAQAQAFIGAAFAQAKRLGMDALAIAVYAVEYILRHVGKIPHNMLRWVGHVQAAQERAGA